MMITHPVLAAIAVHTLTIERGEVQCHLEVCPKCGGRPGSFKYHATRKRQFLVIVDRLIQRVVSALTRWKCPCCGKTFTQYPEFALPNKRYVRQDVCRLGGRYVADDGVSYRRGVQVDRMAVCYDSDGEGQPIDDRVLWPSTLHRWVGFLGSLKDTLQQAWRLIRAKSPTCDVFRKATPVPCWKYRSVERREVLQTCGRLLGTDRAYQDLFDVSIFTHLATLYSWR
jgi:hypothetical protein